MMPSAVSVAPCLLLSIWPQNNAYAIMISDSISVLMEQHVNHVEPSLQIALVVLQMHKLIAWPALQVYTSILSTIFVCLVNIHALLARVLRLLVIVATPPILTTLSPIAAFATTPSKCSTARHTKVAFLVGPSSQTALPVRSMQPTAILQTAIYVLTLITPIRLPLPVCCVMPGVCLVLLSIIARRLVPQIYSIMVPFAFAILEPILLCLTTQQPTYV